MHIIDIAIRNKIAVNTNKTEYVCGNDDFIVRFDFDAEWDDFVHKTARFISNGAYADVVFSGNECAVPVHSGTNTILCGVYAGDLRTTTPALIPARKSILCGSPAPAEPHPDVYAQMVALFNANDAIQKNAKAAALSEQNAKTSEEAAAKSAEEAKDAAKGSVKSVNDITPDEKGNVEIQSAGKKVEGTETEWNNTIYNGGVGAEVFNCYEMDMVNRTFANVASGLYSHAEGQGTLASGDRGSHAEGAGTKAIGNNGSHAEGSITTASGESSHAEGYYSTASGKYAHTEGESTTASGCASHAEGNQAIASGAYSHAEGQGTVATGKQQHVQGAYNVLDNEGEEYSRGKYAHIVGNGQNATRRSNAHTLDWEGNAWYAGSVEAQFMILVSPNGTRFKITVDDNGALTAAAL